MKTWNELSIRDKNDIIRVAVQNGITALPDIRERYNEFAEGGPEEVLERVNSSNADFVQRLKDPDRKTIMDWEQPNMVATHKLGVGTDANGNAYIYPEVQNINGRLVDFTMPYYPSWRGRITAEQRGDTVRVPSIEAGVNFTENYKKYYPNFSYAKGGHIYDGESEDTQQMDVVNSYPMSLQDYIAQRIQDTRDSAINVMNTREYPKVYFNSSPDYVNKYINDTKTAIRGNENLIAGEYQKLYRGWAKGAEEYSYDAIERARKNIEEWRNNIDLVLKHGKAPEGATCIFTVTDSYGNEKAVPGNLSWLAKGKSGRPIYEEKGFKLLDPIEALAQGDIIQQVNRGGIPEHSLMYMGETEQDSSDWDIGRLIEATYSDGNYGKDAIKRKKAMRYVPGHDNVFRFVGNAADSARWTNEYNVLMQNNPVVQKRFGGLI